jgi:hypothetical protein
MNMSMDKNYAGHQVGLRLRGVAPEDVQRGMIVAMPGTVASYRTFRATVLALKAPLMSGRYLLYFAGGGEFNATLTVPREIAIDDYDTGQIDADLLVPLWMHRRFGIMTADKELIGCGCVSSLPQESSPVQ